MRCILAIFLFYSWTSEAQPERELNLPDLNSGVRGAPQTLPPLGEILGNIHGVYGVTFMGPRMNGSNRETYNIYLPDVSSVQAFHSLQVGYEISDQLQVGVGESIAQNLTEGVPGTTGIIHHRSFDWYDPYVYLTLPKWIQVPGWSVFTTGSLSLPLTDASDSALKITSITFSQSWTLKTRSSWRFGMNFFLNPQFYSDPLPDGFQNRQTLYVSLGPTLGYALTPVCLVGINSHFTVEHRSPDPNGFFHLESSIPDTAQALVTLAPKWGPLFLSLTAYYQSLIWNPSPDTSIVGASFSSGF
jgi:hypothetical protein